MARKEEIQYVRYYSTGSAAQKVELLPKKKPQPKPRPKAKKAQKPEIRLDGLATVGIVVAAVMLVCMLVGFAQVNHANQQLQQLRLHVAQLQEERAQLQEQYDQGYDLDQVRVAAESMGLVPKDQVRHIIIDLPEPVVQEAPASWWEGLLENIRSLFA